MINTFVFSRVDFGSVLLAGASNALNKLQVEFGLEIVSLLQSVHWLPVRSRVDFNFLMLTYKSLHGLGSFYRNSSA